MFACRKLNLPRLVLHPLFSSVLLPTFLPLVHLKYMFEEQFFPFEDDACKFEQILKEVENENLCKIRLSSLYVSVNQPKIVN